MLRKFLTIALLSTVALGACTQNQNQENEASEEIPVQNEVIETNEEDIIETSYTNENDEKMDVTFNNTIRLATVVFGGDTIELQQQKAASGMWYQNDEYELRGKGEKIELLKGDEVAFKN